jgi:hypothetical protein
MVIGLAYILSRKCLLKHVIDGKIELSIEMTGRQRGRRKQLMDGLEDTREYWKLKKEEVDCTLWRPSLGRGCGLVERQTTVRMNISCN